MDAQDLAEFLVSHNFDEAFVPAQDAGLAVGGKRQLADFNADPLRARLRLGEADAADARFGVSGSRNSTAIDGLVWFARHMRHLNHTLHGSDMRQLRRSSHHIADRINIRLGGLLKLVYLDEPAV